MEYYSNGIEKRGHTLEEIKKIFPIGAKVSFLCDYGGETDSEWYEEGEIIDYQKGFNFHDGSEPLYWVVIISNKNQDCEQIKNSHIGNTTVLKSWVRENKLESILDEQ